MDQAQFTDQQLHPSKEHLSNLLWELNIATEEMVVAMRVYKESKKQYEKAIHKLIHTEACKSKPKAEAKIQTETDLYDLYIDASSEYKAMELERDMKKMNYYNAKSNLEEGEAIDKEVNSIV